MKRIVSMCVSLALLAVACVPTPELAPPPAPPRDAKTVNASVARTWEAVVERFAESNIMIRTMDRSSGFIAAEPMLAGGRDTDWADCGTQQWIGRLYPEEATYNVLVRGDSTRSTVKATIRWTTSVAAPGGRAVRECSTTGNFEALVEEGIAARAEGRERRDVPLRSLAPRPDTMPMVVADRDGVQWTIRPVASASGRSGFEFWGPDGEVRFVPGTIPGWRSIPAAQWHDTIAGARVIRKKRPAPPPR